MISTVNHKIGQYGTILILPLYGKYLQIAQNTNIFIF